MTNSVDPDQMPHSVASDLGLHCLFMAIGLPANVFKSCNCKGRVANNVDSDQHSAASDQGLHCMPRTVYPKMYDKYSTVKTKWWGFCESWDCFYYIRKTCLYNFDPLKPHFYIVKLGFRGVYIIFLISAQKHRLWVLVRTASARRF